MSVSGVFVVKIFLTPNLDTLEVKWGQTAFLKIDKDLQLMTSSQVRAKTSPCNGKNERNEGADLCYWCVLRCFFPCQCCILPQNWRCSFGSLPWPPGERHTATGCQRTFMRSWPSAARISSCVRMRCNWNGKGTSPGFREWRPFLLTFPCMPLYSCFLI